METLLTYNQAAERFGYRYQTIRLLACKREVITVRDADGRPRISEAAMRRYLMNRLPNGQWLEDRQKRQTPCS